MALLHPCRRKKRFLDSIIFKHLGVHKNDAIFLHHSGATGVRCFQQPYGRLPYPRHAEVRRFGLYNARIPTGNSFLKSGD